MGDKHNSYPWRSQRKYRRVGLSVGAEVESQGRGVKSLGRTAKISEGGLLVFSPHVFDLDTEVVVRFQLPSGYSVEALGVVRHTKVGGEMGLMFVHLNEAARNAIARYVMQVRPYPRRSARIARRFDVVLRWRDLEGNAHEESAYTLMLSKHGGLAACSHRFKVGEDALLWWPEGNCGARIRIVFRQLGRIGSLAEVGFEFVDTDTFWPVRFPADTLQW